MRLTIDVHLGEEGTPLGTLRYDQQGARESAAFEYTAGWLRDAERFAIEPGLPFTAGPQFHRKMRDGSVFHAALADTEPDGWGKRVIQRDHAKRRQQARREGVPAITPQSVAEVLNATEHEDKIWLVTHGAVLDPAEAPDTSYDNAIAASLAHRYRPEKIYQDRGATLLLYTRR